MICRALALPQQAEQQLACSVQVRISCVRPEHARATGDDATGLARSTANQSGRHRCSRLARGACRGTDSEAPQPPRLDSRLLCSCESLTALMKRLVPLFDGLSCAVMPRFCDFS